MEIGLWTLSFYSFKFMMMTLDFVILQFQVHDFTYSNSAWLEPRILRSSFTFHDEAFGCEIGSAF